MTLRIALKVDCDTAEGTRRGVPRLLALFGELRIPATFFFSLGPDRSGRAALRVFTRKGFLRKMLRSRAPALYPWKTMLAGTLLPAPIIGDAARSAIRSAVSAGHETGVHAWDHVGWHDGLPRWSAARVAEEYRKLHEGYRAIVGEPARASACPGWTVSDAYLGVRERYPLRYTSDTRLGAPFRPATADGSLVSAIPEIPTTLPTLDELLGDPRLDQLLGDRRPDGEGPLARVYGEISEDVVHTVHTEVEGGPYLDAFRQLLLDWRGRGAEFVSLSVLGEEARARASSLPVRAIAPIRLPGRAGTVASGI